LLLAHRRTKHHADTAAISASLAAEPFDCVRHRFRVDGAVHVYDAAASGGPPP
jgi:hypothetical protein